MKNITTSQVPARGFVRWLFGLLSGWKGYAVAAAVGGVLLGAGGVTVTRWYYRAEIAGMERDQAQQIADAQALARAIEQRRWAVREGVINDAKEQAAAAAADAAAATSDLERVRAEVKRLRAAARNSAAAGRGPGIESADPIGLLADMYERGATDAVARSGYADALRRAGLMCERLYDSLRGGPAKSSSTP